MSDPLRSVPDISVSSRIGDRAIPDSVSQFLKLDENHFFSSEISDGFDHLSGFSEGTMEIADP